MNTDMLRRERVLFCCFLFLLLLTNSIGVVTILRLIHTPVLEVPPKSVPSPMGKNLITLPKLDFSSGENSQKEKEDLEKLLTVKAAVLGVSDNISLYFKDFSKNYEITIDPNAPWVPASTIKAFVILEAFRQRNNGLINFDQKIIIKKNNVVPTELETYAFPELSEGTRITIRELLDMMITQSDNTAYNTLLDILDRRNINATLKKLGFVDTIVGEKINLDDEQYQNDLQVHGRQQNKTTVHDFSTLFNMLYEKKIADAAEILAIFKRQKVNYMLPAMLPPDIQIAHKTGEFSPYYHDGGIVYKIGNPFTFVVFSNSDRPQIISELGKTAYFRDDQLTSMKQENFMITEDTPAFVPHGIKSLAVNSISTHVLGIQTQKIQLPYNAADFGITTDDLAITAEDTHIIKKVHILPGNILYPFKRFWEQIPFLFEKTNEQKIDFYLHLAAARLAEIKTVLQNQDTHALSNLFTDYESNTKQALILIQSTSSAKNEIIFIKQLNDLLFAIVNRETRGYPNNMQQDLINTIYTFYKVNKKDISDYIKNTGLGNPYKYTPISGKIIQKNGTTLKIRLLNNQIITVKTFLSTQLRTFHEKKTKNIDEIQPCTVIAVIGDLRGKTITPFFILDNIPADFPKNISGTLVAIDFDKQTFRLRDANGQENDITFDRSTVFQSKDTTVTPQSINPGSTLVVRGERVGTTIKAYTAHVITNE